jgi:antitoxin HigA-1
MTRKVIPPIHPGEILREEFMKPLEMSQNRLARDLKVPPRRINEIVHGKRGISIDTALRLSRHFGTSVEFWINLQTHYELEVAEDNKLLDRISREVAPRVAAGSAR